MIAGSEVVTANTEQILNRTGTERNRWAWAIDLNFLIWRSCSRVCWCETSARLFSYWPVRWGTDGKTSR